MTNEVIISYSDYNISPVAQQIKFEFLDDLSLTLKYLEDEKAVSICMADTITANTALEGKLDLEKLNTLIKSLAQLRNQLKDNSKKG